MRPIKFRGRELLTGRLVYSEFLGLPRFFKLLDDGDIELIGQFTGLHDKNGKEIYEGDIINLPDYQFNPVQASFMQGVFGVTGADSVHYPLRAFSKTGSSSIEIESPVEVIGNIYEHKHLLK